MKKLMVLLSMVIGSQAYALEYAEVNGFNRQIQGSLCKVSYVVDIYRRGGTVVNMDWVFTDRRLITNMAVSGPVFQDLYVNGAAYATGYELPAPIKGAPGAPKQILLSAADGKKTVQMIDLTVFRGHVTRLDSTLTLNESLMPISISAHFVETDQADPSKVYADVQQDCAF